MSLYLIGDVQGCAASLARLLDVVAFSPSRDQLVLLGDLVNRGPDSLAVLRRAAALDNAALCLLGNHDLHLLAVAHGARAPGAHDTLCDVLAAPDRAALLDWLRHQRLACLVNKVLCVHAGVLPGWTARQTLQRAAEVEQVLQSAALPAFLHEMYGNAPPAWNDDLQGSARLRVIVNALTRLRFCSASGVMEFDTKDGASAAPAGFWPWFDVPGRRTAADILAFGHWSTLGWLDRADVLALDGGCVWGGQLTAVRVGAQGQVLERIAVACPQAQEPGGKA